MCHFRAIDPLLTNLTRPECVQLVFIPPGTPAGGLMSLLHTNSVLIMASSHLPMFGFSSYSWLKSLVLLFSCSTTGSAQMRKMLSEIPWSAKLQDQVAKYFLTFNSDHLLLDGNSWHNYTFKVVSHSRFSDTVHQRRSPTSSRRVSVNGSVEILH